MILDDIVAKKRLDLVTDELQVSLACLEKEAANASPVRDFYQALAKPGLSIIAEVKKASPSKGVISANFDPLDTALQYQAGGAAAVSVLTEKHFFQGDDLYLRQIRQAVQLPVLRKDFIISPRQVVEARAIGADAILLIAAILEDRLMRELYQLAADYGMNCLFEAHDQQEVARAVDCGARIIGINNRDLKTFAIDLSLFSKLQPLIPPGTLAVAESGIHTPADAQKMRLAGADAILVGESLMRAADIPQSLRDLAGEL